MYREFAEVHDEVLNPFSHKLLDGFGGGLSLILIRMLRYFNLIYLYIIYITY